jgi:hypothetical protein
VPVKSKSEETLAKASACMEREDYMFAAHNYHIAFHQLFIESLGREREIRAALHELHLAVVRGDELSEIKKRVLELDASVYQRKEEVKNENPQV